MNLITYTDNVIKEVCPEYDKHYLQFDLLCMIFGYLVDIERCHYKNGQLIYEIPEFNGKTHGIMKWWHEDGELAWQCPYVNGKKQ